MDVFNYLREAVPLTTVCPVYHIELKKSGKSYLKGKCPFALCGEREEENFVINPEKKLFYCFGCHQNGDVVNFIEMIEKKSAVEAAKKLFYWYCIPLPAEIIKEATMLFGAAFAVNHHKNPHHSMINLDIEMEESSSNA